MQRIHRALARIQVSLRPLFSFAWRTLFTLTVCRTVFVVWQWQRVVDADMLATTYIQGLRFDLALVGLMLLVPVICFPVLASNRTLVPAWRGLLRICLPAVLLVIVFMECCTPSFVDQFDSRPNILFLEYLNSPREVAATLWAAYKVPIIVAVLLVSAITWINSRQIGRLAAPIQPVGVIPANLVTPFLMILCIGLIRSTLDHRPVNLSTVARSADPLVNELAFKSTYTVLYAFEKADVDLADRALAHTSWSSMAYERSLYRPPVALER